MDHDYKKISTIISKCNMEQLTRCAGLINLFETKYGRNDYFWSLVQQHFLREKQLSKIKNHELATNRI